jgi:hypothetical protein
MSDEAGRNGRESLNLDGLEGAGRIVAGIVGAAFSVSPETIHAAKRGAAETAFARQVAIYLSHTRLHLNYTDAGALFGRDRTTAAHACRTVEDRRECPAFDAAIDCLERAIDLWPVPPRKEHAR